MLFNVDLADQWLLNQPNFHFYPHLPSSLIRLSLIASVFNVNAMMVYGLLRLSQQPMKASSFVCRRDLLAGLARFATTIVP